MEHLLNRTLKPCENCLRDSGLTKEKINEVILVGRMTLMHIVQEMVRNFYGKKPIKNINPDKAVALGAVIQGGILKDQVKDMLLLDITQLSLGIKTISGIFTRIINRNTTIHQKKVKYSAQLLITKAALLLRCFKVKEK